MLLFFYKIEIQESSIYFNNCLLLYYEFFYSCLANQHSGLQYSVLRLNLFLFTVTIKQGNGPLDMQNLMNLVKSVNLPGGAQAQTFVVMSNQNTKNGPIVSSAVPIISQNVIQSKFVILIIASVSY